MTRDRNFPDQPAQYVNEIDGQYSHDQRNKKMFPFAEHIKSGNDDSKRERNGDESAQVTHALGAWIDHRVHLGRESVQEDGLFKRESVLARPCVALSIAPSTIARLWILSALRVSAGIPSVNVPQKLRHHAKVPASLAGIGLFGRDKTLAFVKESFRFLHIFTSNVVKAVPADRSFGADNPPDAIPRSAQTFGAPASAKGASNASAHLKDRMRRCAVLPPGPFRIPLFAINRLRVRTGQVASGVKRMDGHIRQQNVVHLSRGTLQNEAERKSQCSPS